MPDDLHTLAEVIEDVTALNATTSGKEAADDAEDSFQYHCALQNKCDALVTINLKDYGNADTSAMDILSPEAFVSKYLF